MKLAGEPKNDAANNLLLLEKLNGAENRKAVFKTVIALIMGGKINFFEGAIEGTITLQMRGNTGFGYDPLFLPAGSDKTFAEMPLEEKNKISHRAKAVDKLVDFLKKLH